MARFYHVYFPPRDKSIGQLNDPMDLGAIQRVGITRAAPSVLCRLPSCDDS